MNLKTIYRSKYSHKVYDLTLDITNIGGGAEELFFIH